MRLGIVLCAIAAFTTIAKAQSNQGKTPMEYIEIAKFKLKEGFSNEQFIETERAVRNGIIKTQKGFISRELSIDISGYWLMDMRFDTKDNMDAWFVVLKQDPTMKALGSMIDFQSVRMEFFNKQF